MTIETILHFSDIHVRKYSRHQEYREIFEELYKSIRSRSGLDRTVIVITGDICHSKTEMAPEQIQVISDLLRNLASITTVIIIPGNHDANLNASDRMDALTPIIENLKDGNIHYLKESGIYSFNNVDFYVWSVFGDRATWPSPENTTKTKICLVHAPIQSAKTHLGYIIDSDQYALDSFKGFDVVLCGDIHLSQILKESPLMIMAGSLCQQNHGEALEGHGYFVYNIFQKKLEEFVEIPNNFGFVTITINNDSEISLPEMPKNVRLRIIAHENVSDVAIKKLLSIIRKNHVILESSIQRKFDSSKYSNNINLVNSISDVGYQNELITAYIAEHFPNTELTPILELNKKFNSQLSVDDLPKNLHWIPLKLKFDNIFSFGESNEIDFQNISGICGIFGQNAIGKTSIFNAISYILFDKTPTCFKGNHIMNSRKNSFSCEFEFQIDSTRYVICRNGSRRKSGEVRIDVEFYSIDEFGKKIILNGMDRRATNSIIRSYVGTYEDFLLTTFAVQNENNSFIDIGQSDRKDLLSQFMGLSIFDKLTELASNEVKDISSELKILQRNDQSNTLNDVQLAIDQNELDLKQLESNLSGYESKIEELNKKISSASGTVEYYSDLVVDNDINSLHYKKEGLESDIEMYENYIISYDTRLELARDEYSHLPVFVNPSGLKHFSNKVSESKKMLETLDHEIKSLNSVLKVKKEQLAELQKIDYNPTCIVCNSNNRSTIESIQKIEAEIQTFYNSLLDYNKLVSEGNKYIDDNKDFVLQYAEYLKKEEREEQLRREIDSLESKLVSNKNSLQSAKNKLEQTEESIQKYYQNSDKIKEIKTLKETVRLAEEERGKLNQSKNISEREIKEVYGQTEVLKEKKKKILSDLQQIVELESISKSYDIYIQTINRNGLPYSLITNIIPVLEGEINSILSQIVGFTISLSADGKNINSTLIYHEDRQWPLELASGMEKIIAGLAIQISLSQISNLPKTSFLLLDEILSPLDSDNLFVVPALFNYLKSKYSSIFLISHTDSVKDSVDMFIDIKRIDEYSHVTV